MISAPSPASRPSAFSLVEVTLALGIVSFCLVSIIGLIPVGLGAFESAGAESAASQAYERVAESIRDGKFNASEGRYVAAGRFEDIRWTTGGDPAVFERIDLNALGLPATDQTTQRLAARVEVTPPAAPGETGRAFISVAAPATSTWDPTVNDGRGGWRNASASVNGVIVFLPRDDQ